MLPIGRDLSCGLLLGETGAPATLPALTRRQFLVAGGVVAAVAVTGGRARAGLGAPTHVVYRLSLRGRRGSQAAKKHNANHLFATAAAADQHRAHPGDRSRIVHIIVSDAEFNRLFPTAEDVVVDLRHLAPAYAIGDCDRNGRVTTDELVRGVQIALGEKPIGTCPEFDRGGDGHVTVDDLVLGVSNALK